MAIYQACLHSNEDDGFCLSRAAKIIRNEVFSHHVEDHGLLRPGCQQKSVPLSLNMIVGDSVLSPDYVETTNKAVLAISQLIKFNMVKNKRRNTSITRNHRHSKEQETPFPLCGIDDTF